MSQRFGLDVSDNRGNPPHALELFSSLHPVVVVARTVPDKGTNTEHTVTAPQYLCLPSFVFFLVAFAKLREAISLRLSKIVPFERQGGEIWWSQTGHR
jgi:hypothetical protein